MTKRLSAFVDSFRRQFGAEAESVARTQAEAAMGPVGETWLSILRMLKNDSRSQDNRSEGYDQLDVS